MVSGSGERRAYRTSERPDQHKELFAAEIDRLASGDGMMLSRELLPRRAIANP